MLPRILLLGMSLAALACGGDSSQDPNDLVTISAFTQAGEDGWVQSDGVVEANGGGPGTGDVDNIWPAIGHRTILTFDYTGIPDGATIVSATIRAYQADVDGTPYTDLGNLLLDHITIQGVLDASDYGPGPGTLALGVATLSTSTSVGYHEADVTTEVIADIAAGRSEGSFRLRWSIFESDNDGQPDAVYFSDGELSCCPGQLPSYIEVTYRM